MDEGSGTGETLKSATILGPKQSKHGASALLGPPRKFTMMVLVGVLSFDGPLVAAGVKIPLSTARGPCIPVNSNGVESASGPRSLVSRMTPGAGLKNAPDAWLPPSFETPGWIRTCVPAAIVPTLYESPAPENTPPVMLMRLVLLISNTGPSNGVGPRLSKLFLQK